MSHRHTSFAPLFILPISLLNASAFATNGLFPAGNGVVAHGAGGAGIANASEAMSLVDNPALLSQLGNQIGGNLHIYYPKLSANLGTGYVDSEIDQTLTPQMAASYQLNEEWTTGVAVTVLGGAGSDYPADLVGDRAGIKAGGIILSPSVSYQIRPNTRLGASLQYAYEQVESDGFSPLVGGFGNNKGDTTGYGFKLGLHQAVTPDLTFGLTYQSKIDVGEIDDHCSGDGLFTLYKASGGDCSLDMPEIFGAGARYQVTPELTTLVDIQYILWESVDVIKDVFGWENRYVYKLGGEYKLNPLLTLRAGFNHSKAPQAKDRIADNVFAGAIVENHYTLGMSYQSQQNLSFSWYYSYGQENELKQKGAVSNPTLSPVTKIKMSEQVIGLSLNFLY